MKQSEVFTDFWMSLFIIDWKFRLEVHIPDVVIAAKVITRVPCLFRFTEFCDIPAVGIAISGNAQSDS